MWAWSVLYTVLILQTALLLPFRLAFLDSDDSYSWRCLDLCLDTLFFLDVLKTFNTAYLDRSGLMETDRAKIAWKYAKSWLVLDLLSCAPMYELQGAELWRDQGTDQQNSAFLRLVRIPRVYRMLKVSRFWKLIQELQNQECIASLQKKIFIKSRTLTLIVFLLVTSILIHMATCLWFLLAKVQDFPPDSWVAVSGLTGLDYRDQYVAALYWVVQTLSTVGYGDIHPQSSTERLFASFWMLCSIFFVSFTVGSISSVLNSMKSAENVRIVNLAVMDEFAEQAQLSKGLAKRLRDAIKYSADRQSTAARLKHSVFSELPKPLKYEVSLAMHRGAVRSLSFFTSRSASFLTTIVPLLSHRFSQRLSYVYRAKDHPDELYFIVKGSVFIMVTEKNAIRRMQKGSYFGEIELMQQIARKFGAVTEVDSELLALSKRGVGKIRKYFREVYEEMGKVAGVRDRLNERARALLFRLLRMTSVRHRRESGTSLAESGQWVSSDGGTPREALRLGSVKVHVPIIGRQFDPADSFEHLHYRMKITEWALSQVNNRLKKLSQLVGLPE